MPQFFRFSLAQTFLLVGLVAFVVAIAADYWRHHFHVTSNHPALAVSPDGNHLAMNCSFRPLFHRRHAVLVQDRREPTSATREFESHSWVISDVAWTADGSQVVSSSGDRTIRFWDAMTGGEVNQIHTESHDPSCLALSPDERFIATGGHPLVKVWDIQDQRAVATLNGHKRWTWAIGFSPDGEYLATGCIDEQLQIWETASWKLVNSVKLTTAARHLEFSPDGRLITAGYKPKTKENPWQCIVSVYEVPSGKLLDELPIKETWAAVSSVAVSRDGRFLAAAHGGNRSRAHCAVTIWDFPAKQELKTLEINDHGENWIDALAFSTDGETVYCGSMDGKVTAQEWRSGESTVVFTRPELPWKLSLAIGLVWLVAWFYAPRLPRKQAELAADRIPSPA